MLLPKQTRHFLFCGWVLVLLLTSGVPCLAGQWGMKVRDWTAGSGVEIVSVVPDSPAARGGIKSGDIILEADGCRITSAVDLIEMLRDMEAERSLMLKVSRGGWLKEIKLTDRQAPAKKWLGLKVVDQPPYEEPGHGARIKAVTRGGPADKAGLRIGDVITYSEGHKIWRAKDFVPLVRSLPSGEVLSLTVVRQGWERDIVVTPGARPQTRKEEFASVKDSASEKAEQDPCAQGWLGADIENMSDYGGIEIKRLQADSAAQQAGFEVGDIIKVVDGVKMHDSKALMEFFKKTRPGQELSFVMERHGRPQTVVAIMGRVPEDVCLHMRINQALVDKDLSRAKSLAATLTKNFPYTADGHSVLGFILKEEGNLDAAKRSLKRAIELAPKISAYKSNLGTIYLTENDFIEAERYFRLALEDDPNDQITWGNMGDLYRKQNRLSEATEAYHKAIELGPPQAWMLHALALCLRKQGRQSEAKASLDRAIELAPDYPPSYFTLGDIYLDVKKWQEAGKYYEKGLELNPEVQLAWTHLGKTYQNRYMFSEAVAAYRKALDVGPPNLEILINLGIVLRLLQNYSRARESCEKALEIDPDNTSAHIVLGDIYFDQRDWLKAGKYYRLAAKREPQLVPVWMRLGDIHSQKKSYSKAIEAYEEALEVATPDQRLAFGGRIYYGLGWSFFQKGKYAEAERFLRESLKFSPDNPDALITLGTAIAKQKRMAEAQKFWQKAAELDPGGETGQAARQNLAKAGFADALKGISVPIAGRPDGLKATVVVGDFRVKAATAGQVIGDGLREMLLTGLHNSGYFIVLERIDISGLAAEQALSRSAMAKRGTAISTGQMDVASIMVYGAVTEFESEAQGTAMWMSIPDVPFAMGASQNEAHMAIDIRVVDVATGRLLSAQHIPGSARSVQGTFGTNVPISNFDMPVSFSMFRNTPMEQAIRNCIQKAIYYVVNNIPESYFREK